MPDPYSSPSPSRRPLHPMVLGLPFICFLGALFTDIAYARSYDIGWKNFSDWLLAGGMVLGALAALVGIFDLARPAVRANRLIWLYAVAYGIAMILALVDNLIHSRDAYGAMPAGLILSVLTVLTLCVTAALGAVWLRSLQPGEVR